MFGKILLEDTQFLKDGLRQPYLVIENALEPDFAERLREELLASDAWEADDKYQFSPEDQAKIPADYSFQRDRITLDSPNIPGAARELYAYLTSSECLRWASEVSGRMCNGFSGACAKYTQGGHLTSHNDLYSATGTDGSITTRTVTFNYYLSRNWNPEWGGRFVWEKPYAAIAPSFNTLVMFIVGPESHHYVEAVGEMATEPRLAITGWFTDSRKKKKLNLGRS